MKALLALLAAVLVALVCWLSAAAPALADPGTGEATPTNPSYSPPFIDHTEWTHWGGLDSWRVPPTPSGRAAARQPRTWPAADEAWAEVLAFSPDADTAG